ncbi:MAG: VOC family protein [Actinomycetota bacterium]
MAEHTEPTTNESMRAVPLAAERFVDHIVWGTADTDAAIHTLHSLTGVQARIGSMPQHSRYPTRSAGVGLGDGAFFEIYGPNPNYQGPPSFFHDLLVGLDEPRLLTWFVRVNDLPAMLRGFRELGHEGTMMIDEWERTEAASFRNAQFPSHALDSAMPRLIEWNRRVGMDDHLAAEMTLQTLRVGSDDPDVQDLHRMLGLHIATDIRFEHRPQTLTVELDCPNGKVSLR